ncbi:hypothetical protein OKW48_001855 [Paraburkholderia youngii]
MDAISRFALGAIPHMSVTRGDILVIPGTKISELRSLVVCLGDAVAATIDVESALGTCGRSSWMLRLGAAALNMVSCCSSGRAMRRRQQC